MAKRFLMTQLWRIQQSYTLVSLGLWGIVISLTAFPFISQFVQGKFGVDYTAPGVVAITLILLFLAVFTALFLFGVIYDKYLRLWREQLDVAVERKPHPPPERSPQEILVGRYNFPPRMKGSRRGSPNT